MNFKVRDTAWFIGVGSSVLSFMLGLFSGFFLSGIPIFFVNMLLLMIGSVTVISGAGLLLAAAEVHGKLYKFKENALLQAHGNLYSVAVGEDRDSLTAHEVMNSLQEEPVTTKASNVSDKTAAISIIEYPAEKHDVFDLEASHKSFEYEEINPLPLTPTELLEKIDRVQTIIAHKKELSPIKEDTVPGSTQARIVTLEYPKTKPTIHELASNNSVETIDASHNSVETTEIAISTESKAIAEVPETLKKKAEIDLKKIILIGDKGIDPSSEQFKVLLERASGIEDEDFVLRLKGKTFGLGARGIKIQRKNTEFTVFNKSDIRKMLKKFN